MSPQHESRCRPYAFVAVAFFAAGLGIAIAAFANGFTLPGATSVGVTHPDPATLRDSAFLQLRLASWTIPGCLASIALGGAMAIAWQTLRSALAKTAKSWWLLGATVVAMIWALVAGNAILDDYYVVLGNAYSESAISYVARMMGTLGAGAIVILPASMFACAIGGASEVSYEQRRDRLNLLLYLTAAGLAAGAIAARARLELAISPELYAFDQAPVALGHALELAKLVSLAYGGLFTVILVAVYPTAAYHLRKLGDAQPPKVAPKQTFQDLFKLAGHLLAVLGPLLAPFFENLFL